MTLTDTTVDFGLTEVPDHNGHAHDEHDGRPYKNPLEIWKPPTDDLEGYFDMRVEDPHGIYPPGIIKETTPWQLRFSIWLLGDIWKCVSGTMCYEVYFERADNGQRTSLSAIVGHPLEQDFEGCRLFDDGRVHLDYVVRIPAGAVPAGDVKPAVYDLTAVVAFRNPCGEMGVITGHDKGHVQIYGH